VDEKGSRENSAGGIGPFGPLDIERDIERDIESYGRMKGCFNVGLRINNHCPFSHEIHAGSSEACKAENWPRASSYNNARDFK